MSKRAREYVLLAVTVVAAVVYGWLTRDWSVAPLLGGMVGIFTVLALVGMPWVECAPDGAFRRRPQS
jgi:hypothetical protein